MLSKLTDFLGRHKKKFIVSGVLIGGTYLTVLYAQKKLREFQEKQVREFLEKSKKVQHYESTEKTCNQIITGIGTNLYNNIIKLVDAEEVLEKLRGNPDGETKIRLWEELKVISLVRLTSFIYASSMLVITLRVQMNLLGGYLYKDISSEKKTMSSNIQQAYLSHIQYFLNNGIVQLIDIIKETIATTTSSFTLTKQFNLADIENHFWTIQMAINSKIEEPNMKMVKFMFPQNWNEVDIMNELNTETLDILESDEVTSLCSNNICRGFSIALDHIAENMKESSISEGGMINYNKISMPLAMLIPIFNSLTISGFDNSSKPHNFATSQLSSLLVNDKVKTLGANVYEVFAT